MLQGQPCGLVFDVDGTIAELGPTAEAVRVSPGCRRKLRALVGRLPVLAAISGRLPAVVRKLVGIDGIVYYGNHGLEKWVNGHSEMAPSALPYVDKMRGVIRELGPALSPLGVRFEDKGAGLVFHYRTLPDRDAVRQRIIAEVERCDEAREFKLDAARAVVELRPPLDISKGSILKEVVRDYALRAVVYLGDDVSDVDAFEAVHDLSSVEGFRGMALGVVGRDTPPIVIEKADFLLRSVTEVQGFLGLLEALIPPRPRQNA